MARRYLVSFCNNTDRLRLAVLTPRTVERVIDLGSWPLPVSAGGITGISIDRDCIVVGLQCRGQRLLLELDREYQVRTEIPVRGASDLHGVLVAGSEIIAVSTGTNQVLSISRQDHREQRTVWSDAGPSLDRDHINDLHLRPDGALLMSRFGPRRSDGLRSGSVVEVATGHILLDGLREPHSPFWWNGRLHVLESPVGDLICVRPGHVPERLLGISGYARGLTVDDEYIAIGKSGYRELSRSRLGDDRPAPIAVPSVPAGSLSASGIFFIAQADKSVSWVDTTHIGPEIYQILGIEDS